MHLIRSNCFFLLIFLFIFPACAPSNKAGRQFSNQQFVDQSTQTNTRVARSDAFMSSLLGKYPRFFDSIMKNRDTLGVQIIYTRIDRKKNGQARFTDHFYNLDAGKYFYPASTVKLPVAILALQRLNELAIPGLDKYTTMITESDHEGQTTVYNDSTAQNGLPCIAHYIRKILLVSDNDAFNRLYEFLGQEYINNSLHKMGYDHVQIIHRLNISLTEDQNRHTNPVKFVDANNKIIYEQPGRHSQLAYAKRNTKLGKGYMKGGELINEPFDFSIKNRLPLQDMHMILRSIIFPDRVPAAQRFNLTADDYAFLRRYMSMMPQESRFPSYDSTEYPDTYVKFLYYGAERDSSDPLIRSFNKPGDAYGFMIDAAYIADFRNNIEFMVSAVIYCNSDGIFNDDQYDYRTLGYPFMKNLGRVVYDYELQRRRKYPPDLSAMKFDYRE